MSPVIWAIDGRNKPTPLDRWRNQPTFASKFWGFHGIALQRKPSQFQEIIRLIIIKFP
jgi:hypothetical protein